MNIKQEMNALEDVRKVDSEDTTHETETHYAFETASGITLIVLAHQVVFASETVILVGATNIHTRPYPYVKLNASDFASHSMISRIVDISRCLIKSR